jgi:Domain of unknown function (DUF3303)
MLFAATLTHPPELCFARKEFAADFKKWSQGMNDNAKTLGITIQGAYLSPNEHTFHFILEAKDLNAVSAFFSGVMLTHNTGRISPVIPLQEAGALLPK